MEECGRRSLRPVSFLVPLELDCHHEDGEIRQCLRDNNQGNDDNDDDDDITATVDSISRLGAGAVPIQQQAHRNGAFLTTRHLRSQQLIKRRAAPERAARPTAPRAGATSTTLGLPTHTRTLSHQIF